MKHTKSAFRKYDQYSLENLEKKQPNTKYENLDSKLKDGECFLLYTNNLEILYSIINGTGLEFTGVHKIEVEKK